MIQLYKRGASVGMWAYIKDWEGNYASPDNGVKVTLTDPKGTKKVDAQAMNQSTTGIFYYFYNSQEEDELGWWHFKCVGQDGTGGGAKYIIADGSFELK